MTGIRGFRVQLRHDPEEVLLESRLSQTNVDWLSEAKRDFDLMAEIPVVLREGTEEQKKDLLHAFGSNLSVSAKKLTVTNKKSVEAFKNCLVLTRTQNEAFEPAFTLASHDKTEVFASVRPALLRLFDEITTYFKTTKEYHYIPNLKDGIYPLTRPTSEQLKESYGS